MKSDYERILQEAEFQVEEGNYTWKQLFYKVIVLLKEEEEAED